eukprot:scaffold2676_cov145-Pinguiococcus_pyrenoidosus.AAC.1
MSGTLLAVGATGDDDKGTDSGSVYVFERDSTADEWAETQKLTASDGRASDVFGFSVSTSGAFLAVGAPGDDDTGSTSGSVYVFERSPTADKWMQVQKLTASDGSTDDYFGRAVSVSGTFLAVGSYLEDAKGTDSGSVYVFERNSTADEWAEVQKLTASDGSSYDFFGRAVSMSGTFLAVGAHLDDAKGTSSGSVYVFERNSTADEWAEVQKLTASDGRASDYFGFSVSTNGAFLAVGAYGDDDKGSSSGS